MKIAVIPSRGSSKRIPRKNARVFCGKPMISWTINTAKESCLVDHIIVSTDDNGITNVARDWGTETPFKRPDDLTRTVPVIANSIQRAMRRLPSGEIQHFNPQFELTRTQDLEVAYHYTGQF
jgi:pseudaminic acid cytidylyltransferase